MMWKFSKLITAVRQQQIQQLIELREARDEQACQAALERLTNGAEQDGNLLALSIDAAESLLPLEKSVML